MPKPIFIIVCQTGTQDKDTGAISLFHVVEKIEATILKPPPEGFQGPIFIQTMPLRVVATWMKSDDDAHDQEFDFHIAGYMPPDRKVGFEANGKFTFAEGMPLHRLTVNISGQIPITEPGVMWVENRVRKSGTDSAWLSQEYPILISTTEVTPMQTSNGKTSQNP
jgi:hypothetical protein